MSFYLAHHILSRLLRGRNLTADQIAEELGIAPVNRVRNWESGKSRIPRKDEERLLAQLGSSPAEIGEVLVEIAREEFGFDEPRRPTQRLLESLADLLKQNADVLPQWLRFDFERRLLHLETLYLQVHCAAAELEGAIHEAIAEARAVENPARVVRSAPENVDVDPGRRETQLNGESDDG